MNKKELKSDKDIEEILSIAVSKSGGNDEQALRARMHESAKELGLSPEEVEAAEEHWRAQALLRDQKERYIQTTRASFIRNLFLYMVVNGAFFALSAAANERPDWVLFSLVIWGIFVVMSSLKFIASYFPKSSVFESNFDQWLKSEETGSLDKEIERRIELKIKKKIEKELRDDEE